jgi:hypothetical protein
MYDMKQKEMEKLSPGTPNANIDQNGFTLTTITAAFI